MLGVALIGFMLLGVLSLWIESNDSMFAGITKKEYITVLRGMMNESGNGHLSVPESTTKWNGDVNKEIFNVATTTYSSLQPTTSKKDSFYWLQQTVKSRTLENREVRDRTLNKF